MDVFDKCVVNMGPLGKYAEQAEGYYMFPKLEGEISNDPEEARQFMLQKGEKLGLSPKD